MMTLEENKPEAKALLDNISFFDRFRELSNSFPVDVDRWAGIPKQAILRAIKVRVPDAKVKNRGGLFMIEEIVSDVRFQYNLFFKHGLIEHIFGTKIEGKVVLSGPVAHLRQLYDNDPIIKHPAYCSLADIFSILDKSLDVYHDYKVAILEHCFLEYNPVATLRILNPVPTKIIQIDSPRHIIVKTGNQHDVFEKSHKMKVDDSIINFTSVEFTNFVLLADEIGYENAEELLATLSHSGSPWFNSPEGLSYSYSRLGGLIILFSSGEIQPGLYRLIFEGAWKERH